MMKWSTATTPSAGAKKLPGVGSPRWANGERQSNTIAASAAALVSPARRARWKRKPSIATRRTIRPMAAEAYGRFGDTGADFAGLQCFLRLLCAVLARQERAFPRFPGVRGAFGEPEHCHPAVSGAEAEPTGWVGQGLGSQTKILEVETISR
jgi:hypothetical protein